MNKLLTSCLLVAGLVFVGCQKKTPQASDSSASSGNPLTAPVDYLAVQAKAKKMADKTLGAAGINQAIGMFQAEKGRAPKNLNELVPDYLPSVPPAPAGMKYDYNSSSGALKVVPQ
ncbi:MAG TPA: hypothetical protein VMZ27_08330 [Candidatus Saccharimonadales bacterium]|nr:hypothetical protein [Candidatus Saccharimonadales bacterium]